MIRKVVRLFFNALGFEIMRRHTKPRQNSGFADPMSVALERVTKLKLSVNTIVDVGAAQGKWSLAAKKFWPEVSYILFEPLEERKAALENLSKKNANFYFIPEAAGKEKGEIKFVIASDLDGSGVASDLNTGTVRTVSVTSIQEEVKRLDLKGPYYIKLDTHGFEIPILEGCIHLMDEIELFIIESYGFQIAKDSLLFWEMCRYMDSQGFRLYDIVDIMHREKDGAFWQCDAFFIKKGNALFMDNSYV